MGFVYPALVISGVLVLLSTLYHLLPFKLVSNEKPLVCLFPKYTFPIDEESSEQRLLDLKFQRHKNSSSFVRGYYFGDGFANLASLCVRLEGSNTFIYSPIIAILFDTGDLWRLAKGLQHK